MSPLLKKKRCLEIFHSQFYQVSDGLSNIQRPPPTSGRMDKQSHARVFSVQLSKTFFKAKNTHFETKESQKAKASQEAMKAYRSDFLFTLDLVVIIGIY